MPVADASQDRASHSLSTDLAISASIDGLTPIMSFDDPAEIFIDLSGSLTDSFPGFKNVDSLIGLYYTFFHSAHPCALPFSALKRRLAEDPRPLRLVVLVMAFIGSFYTQSVSSKPLEVQIQAELTQLQQPLTGFDVQALLLYSIAVYWSNEIERSIQILDQATSLALSMGMQYREFADLNGQGEPFLEECWRRTWWQVYIVDMSMALSHHLLVWKTSGIAMTTELPCEEHEYEIMVGHRCSSHARHTLLILAEHPKAPNSQRV